MIRYLTEDDVDATLDVATAIELLDAAARKLAAGEAQVMPRQRVRAGQVGMNMLVAALDGRVGYKVYTTGRPGGAVFRVTLFGTRGEMLAIVEADRLGQIRTGAASGLATRLLARPDADIATVVGTGWQARTQLEAVARVRALAHAYAFGRDAARARAFCDEMTALLRIPVEPVTDLARAVRESSIVCTMTNATEPLLLGAMLADGTHVNAAGSNRANAAEIDPEVVRRSAVVAVEDLAQAGIEAGDLLRAQAAGAWDWSRAVRLAELVAGTVPGRGRASDVTLFESLGIGLWDIAAANYVYDRCIEQGRGREVDIPA